MKNNEVAADAGRMRQGRKGNETYFCDFYHDDDDDNDENMWEMLRSHRF